MSIPADGLLVGGAVRAEVPERAQGGAQRGLTARRQHGLGESRGGLHSPKHRRAAAVRAPTQVPQHARRHLKRDGIKQMIPSDRIRY